jgi:hypothetical protein
MRRKPHVTRSLAALVAILMGISPFVEAAAASTEGPTTVETKTAPNPPANQIHSEFLGSLTFEDGYATPDTLKKLYDQLDFQRATQSYMRNLLGLNMYGFRLGLARDLGVKTSNELAIFRATAVALMLTPNSETLYGTTFLALDHDGPTVVEVGPGVLGLVNDMWMRPVADMGLAGPDEGKGGKYLFVPPAYTGALPQSGYFIVHQQTYGAWVLLRGLLDPKGNEAPAQALLRQTRIYPYDKRDAAPTMTFVDATGKPFDTTTPGDIRAFEWLSDLVQHEYPQALDPDAAGMLQTIGIDRDKPFKPDDRMHRILDEAAHAGSYMAQAVSFAPRDPAPVREGSYWQAGLTGYPTFADDRATLWDPMIRMGWFATGAAKAMNAPKPGTGSQYVWTYFDNGGQWLRGEISYRLHLPPNPPAKNFWSILVYDNWTRAIHANGQKVAGKNSYDRALAKNADGSIDIYFGPKAPLGKEANWIRTVPGKGWFTIFRLYGPLQAWFDRAWVPDDIVPLGDLAGDIAH